MQRIEYIDLRLRNWALWKARGADGGRGFPGQSTLCSVHSTDGYREAIIPIDDPDASEMNAAVEALSLHLRETVEMVYLGDGLLVDVAQRFGRAVSTIKARLAQADHDIAAWLRAKHGRTEPVQVKGSLW